MENQKKQGKMETKWGREREQKRRGNWGEMGGGKLGKNRKKNGEKKDALTGNRTRASRVAGENSTTEPSVLPWKLQSMHCTATGTFQALILRPIHFCSRICCCVEALKVASLYYIVG